MDRYRFVLTDRAGEPFGEVQDALQRKVEIGLKKPAVAGFTIRGTNDLVGDLYAADRLLKVYHYLPPRGTEQLIFHGPVTSIEATVDDKGPLIATTATDPSFYFSKRVVGKAAEWTAGFQGTVLTGLDKVTAALQLIQTAHNDGTMLLDASARITLAGTTVSNYLAGPYKKLDECIADLADTADGFEWIVDPLEFTGAAIGTWRTAPIFGIGSDRANAAFEYGPDTRANIHDYTFQRSWVDMANNIYNIPTDLTTGTILEHSDAASIAEHGLYDDALDSGELTNTTLRTAVDNYHLTLRKQPRNVVTFTPVVDPTESATMVPLFNYDFNVGDKVPILIENDGQTLISGQVRVWKMNIEIDQQDRVSYTPTTTADDASGPSGGGE